MRFLLDTHAFIWLLSGGPELSANARAMTLDPGNELLISTASLWEMGIKSNQGKLTFAKPFPEFINGGLREHNIALLRVELQHILEFEQLPRLHKDPFDRMIAAQALEEEVPVIGRDRMLDEYGVDRRW
jgi:PIN domain nuclease of toxin-antitoxin system